MKMRNATYLVAILCAAAITLPAAAGERVYKRIGEDGVVEFTDVPGGNAEEVEISEPQTYRAPPLPAAEPQAAAPQDVAFTYILAIVSPASEQAFPPGPGDIPVTVKVDPPVEARLRHRLELVVDGKPRPLAGTRVTLKNMDRGAHTVSVRVVDGSGKVIGESAAVTFYVQRPSILSPGRAPKASPSTP